SGEGRAAKWRPGARLRALSRPCRAALAQRGRSDRRAGPPRSCPRRRYCRDHSLAEANRAACEGARPESSSRINRFAPLRGLLGAERKRARPGARTGRACANIFRGARGLPRREANMNRDNDHDHDRDSDHANDNGDHEKPGSKQVASAPAGGALTSLAALQAALANVNTAAIIGRTGLPMMLFKSREDSGTWGFWQKHTIPEADSRWAINPSTFKYGAICFNGNKVVDERLVPISQPKPVITEMPDTGFPWQEEWAVNMKCTNGADAGVEVVFKATTDGALKAV